MAEHVLEKKGGIHTAQLYNDFRKFRLMPDISEVTSPPSHFYLAPSSFKQVERRGKKEGGGSLETVSNF